MRSKYRTASNIPDAELPKQFDLRNVNGIDFTGEIRNQQKCGSCYTMSFVQVVESRIKYKLGQHVGSISAQHLL